MSKTQKELLDGGSPEEKLKIRNREPYIDRQVQLDIQNSPAHWLGFLRIPQLITRRSVNIEKRSRLINAVINSDFYVLCLCGALLNNNINESELSLNNLNIYRPRLDIKMRMVVPSLMLQRLWYWNKCIAIMCSVWNYSKWHINFYMSVLQSTSILLKIRLREIVTPTSLKWAKNSLGV